MSMPLHIVFRHLDHSPSLERYIRSKASRLERYQGQIIQCRVVIDAPHHHHHKGNGYRVTVETVVPGHELVVNQKAGGAGSEDDIYAAIGRALNRASAQVRAYTEKRVEHHTPGFRQFRRSRRRIDTAADQEVEADPYSEDQPAGAPIALPG